MTNRARVAVVGATGAVGTVTLALLRERGYGDVRAFASARTAGSTLGGLTVEEATPEVLGAGDLDLCLFSVGATASRRLVPVAAAGGALCVDKSSAFRLEHGVPLVVPEVNGDRALENAGILANPNCCSIPLTMVLAPLRDAAGLRRVRVATYQSVSGAGASAMDQLRGEPVEEPLRYAGDPVVFTPRGDAFLGNILECAEAIALRLAESSRGNANAANEKRQLLSEIARLRREAGQLPSPSDSSGVQLDD